MKIINLQQGSPEWLEWRSQGIGSSDIACIMGCGFTSRKELFFLKSGFTDPFVNKAMKRGSAYESEARQFICDRTGLSYEPICVEHDDYPFLHASLDGWNEMDKSLIEIKVPNSNKAIEYAKSGNIPDKYFYQIQWQLLITKAEMALYCVYDVESKDVFIQDVCSDFLCQEMLLENAIKFWEDFKKGIIHQEDEEDYLEFEGPEFFALEEEYKKAHLEAKIAEENLSRIKSKIYDIADDGNFKFGKIRCTKMKGKTSFDTDKMKRDGLNIDQYRKVGGYFYKISIEK